MKPMRIAAGLCIPGMLAMLSTAFAHDLFIKPDQFFMEPGVDARVPFMNGTFVESEASFSPDRLRDLSIVSPAGRRQLDPSELMAGENASWIRFEPEQAGVHLIGASLKTREITLSAADFDAYLAHDGIPHILAARQETKPQGDVLEVYEKHVKAVVQVGAETSGPFDTVLAYAAEIVLLDNPYQLGIGDEIRFRCLVEGRPVARQFVLIGGEQGGALVEERSTRTDEHGVAAFTLERAGKQYLRFIHMKESEQEGVDYHSKWATFTFEIGK
jgi:hypothetical protein